MAKKIGAITSVVIVLLAVITTIILGSVKIDHNIECKNPDEIWIRYNNQSPRKMQDEDAEEVVKLINNATKENLLTALINSTANEKPELVQYKTTNSNIPSNSNYYLIYSYGNKQKVTYKDTDVYYSDLMFTIADTDGKDAVKVYLSEDGSMKYKYYYVINVDYSEVFNFLEENNYNN